METIDIDPETMQACMRIIDQMLRINHDLQDCFLVRDPARLAELVNEVFELHGFTQADRQLFISRFQQH